MIKLSQKITAQDKDIAFNKFKNFLDEIKTKIHFNSINQTSLDYDIHFDFLTYILEDKAGRLLYNSLYYTLNPLFMDRLVYQSGGWIKIKDLSQEFLDIDKNNKNWKTFEEIKKTREYLKRYKVKEKDVIKMSERIKNLLEEYKTIFNYVAKS